MKAKAKETYLKLEQAEKEEADATNLERHLKEQLEIISDEDEEKREVALKADAIAKRMAEMAAKADGAWHEVQQAKRKTAQGYAEAQATAKATKEADAAAEKLNKKAEDIAQLASTKLAKADREVRNLLQVSNHIKFCTIVRSPLTSPSPAQASVYSYSCIYVFELDCGNLKVSIA